MAARGHEVTLQTWERWQEDVEREGMRFEAASEYRIVDGPGLRPYQAAVRGARETVPLIEELDPHVVVSDILTVAGGLAAQVAGRRWATLIPHVYPVPEAGMAPYSSGARLPRTRLGREWWRSFERVLQGGAETGRRELNGARERVGLPPLDYPHGGISRELALVATYPQLEYPRADLQPSVRFTGPLLWERPYHEVELPPGDAPLVLVAPSTSQDPAHTMVRAALAGLADEPVRVLTTLNSRPAYDPLTVPPNARVVDWLSYSRTMPRCDAVVCHAGHGTVARALASGTPVVGCPAAGDMAENAARLTWSGTGVSLPRRFITPRGVRLAVRKVLADPGYAERAGRLCDWATRHDGAATAADHVEKLAAP
jgi:UDP:flavonoid glycosyltransferase YjiC (YdhE family)